MRLFSSEPPYEALRTARRPPRLYRLTNRTPGPKSESFGNMLRGWSFLRALFFRLKLRPLQIEEAVQRRDELYGRLKVSIEA